MSKVAFLFPGQGSQYVGMGQDLHEHSEKVRELYRRASDILGYDLAEVSFHGPEERLKETIVTQPAILVHSLSWLMFLEHQAIEPDYAAGHSLGEYSALVAAGVFTYEDAIRAVDTRCKAMQEACEQHRGTMAAIIGMEDQALKGLLKRMSLTGVCVAANYNSPGQVVISGDYETVEKALPAAKELGAKRAMLIPVGGAFHSPLMASAMERLGTTLNRLTFHRPRFPIVPNVIAVAEDDTGMIKLLLERQLISPVKWSDTLLELSRLGVPRFVEIGPGKVLSGLVKRTVEGAETFNLDRLSDWEAVQNKLLEIA